MIMRCLGLADPADAEMASVPTWEVDVCEAAVQLCDARSYDGGMATYFAGMCMLALAHSLLIAGSAVIVDIAGYASFAPRQQLHGRAPLCALSRQTQAETPDHGGVQG